MGVLTIATAALVAGTGYGVTRNRLDSEISDSLASVLQPAQRDRNEAFLLCTYVSSRSIPIPTGEGVGSDDRDDGPSDDRDDGPSDDDDRPGVPRRKGRGGRRILPREVLVQCLDQSGAPINPDSAAIPIGDRDKQLAASGRSQSRTATVPVDGVPYRVTTASIPDLGAIQVARSLAERNRVLRSLLRRSTVAALLSGLVAGLIGLWLAKRLVRPLEQLSDAAEQVARTGVLSVPDTPPSRGNDETKRLTSSFHEMLVSLRQSREAQARLVQDAGHELRTPLTSLRANVSLLKRADLPNDKRQVALDDLDLELRELTLVTNELVSLAGETGEPEAAEDFDLGTLVTETAERWSRRSGRTVTTDFTTPSEVVGSSVVHMPENAIRRAVDNILSNAIKFSPEDTQINVTIRPMSDHIEVTVRDHGPGVPPADQQRIFERFYRADTARSVSGSGLGLSIVHDTMVSVGGTVSASNHQSGGAVMTLVFPRPKGTA